MFAYVLTFMLIGGPQGPTHVEVAGLRSIEHCRQVVNQRARSLPRNVRLQRPVCEQRGYLT